MIALVVIAAQAAAATFAPPLDRPIRVTTESRRVDSGTVRTFRSSKRIVFRREGAGFRSEVTIEPGETPVATEDPTAMFGLAMARLAGRALVFHLDAQGRATDMVDQAGAWQGLMDGLAALSPPGTKPDERARLARGKAVRDAFGALPVERQRAMLASMVTSLVGLDVLAEGAGPPLAVRVPANSAFGSVQLDGLRSVREARGMVEVSVSATGPVAIKSPDGTATGQVVLDTLRRIDPRTGMIVESRESVRTILPDGSLGAERMTTTRVQH